MSEVLPMMEVVLATYDIRSEKSGDVPRKSRMNNPLVLAP